MKIKFVLLLSFLTFLACEQTAPSNDSRVDTLPFYKEATFTPHWLKPNDPALTDFHRIAPFSLVNQEGDTITEKTFDQKIYVVDFFFTICPGICPKMTDNMMALQDEFIADEDVLLLSHSVTPERDSVPVLKNYAEEKGISKKTWHLATGTKKEIYKLGRKDYFVEEDLGLQK
ncbi:MAG: SCO family protein, partial [Saprospiraceae bacterium]